MDGGRPLVLYLVRAIAPSISRDPVAAPSPDPPRARTRNGCEVINAVTSRQIDRAAANHDDPIAGPAPPELTPTP
jgi:hypothetical protein